MATRADAEKTLRTRTRRIVAGVDGSANAMVALEWAATQAQRTGDALEIVTAFGRDYVFLNPSEVDRVMDKDIDDATVRAKTVAPEVVISSRTYAGSPEAVLLEESAGADLLVVGSRGRGGFTGLLLGSVGRNCVHRAECPVLVVGRHGTGAGTNTTGIGNPSGPTPDEIPKPQEETGTRPPATHRIVVGVDGSSSSWAALEWAAYQAQLTGAVLDVLMTWHWPYGYRWSPIPNSLAPEHASEKQLNELLEPVRRTHPNVSVQPIVAEGRPAPLLVNSSHGADLLVVGRRGHGGFSGMLLGSVSEHCVTHAHCPVLVVRGPK